MSEPQIASNVDPPPEPAGHVLPVLWHLKVSNYNEKARWALDYKGVDHLRRAGLPGQHARVARQLTGGQSRTFPVLALDGDVIADSTRIIEALESRFPEPPLYPDEDIARRRALELEEFFDENLGAYIRLLFIHIALQDPALFLGAFLPSVSFPRRVTARMAFPVIRPRIISDFGIDAASVEHAYQHVRAAGERFRAERQPSGYLVGDSFTVADLTLAALLAPVVAPEQFPYPQPQRGDPRFAAFRDLLGEYDLLEWTREMYARHRGRSVETVDRLTDRLYSRLPR